MSTKIPQRDLRNHNAQIIARVAAGESFVVTRDGVPVADVTPHAPTNRPPMFPRTETLEAFVSPGPVDVEAWLADTRTGDDAFDDSLADPWEQSRG